MSAYYQSPPACVNASMPILQSVMHSLMDVFSDLQSVADPELDAKMDLAEITQLSNQLNAQIVQFTSTQALCKQEQRLLQDAQMVLASTVQVIERAYQESQQPDPEYEDIQPSLNNAQVAIEHLAKDLRNWGLANRLTPDQLAQMMFPPQALAAAATANQVVGQGSAVPLQPMPGQIRAPMPGMMPAVMPMTPGAMPLPLNRSPNMAMPLAMPMPPVPMARRYTDDSNSSTQEDPDEPGFLRSVLEAYGGLGERLLIVATLPLSVPYLYYQYRQGVNQNEEEQERYSRSQKRYERQRRAANSRMCDQMSPGMYLRALATGTCG